MISLTKLTPVKHYLITTREPLFAFVVTSPLLLLYNLAYIFNTSSIRNGVDFFSRFLFRYTGHGGFILVNGGLLIASVIAGLYLKKHGKLSLKIWGIVTVEGLLYGLFLGKMVLLIMANAHLLSTAGNLPMSRAMKVLMAAGAGYHEELIFRLLPMGIALRILPRVFSNKKIKQGLWLTAVILIASVLFSLAHFMGMDSFSWFAFWFRFLSGILFSLLYLTRGFTSAAYAHFIYDVMVMLF